MYVKRHVQEYGLTPVEESATLLDELLYKHDAEEGELYYSEGVPVDFVVCDSAGKVWTYELGWVDVQDT